MTHPISLPPTLVWATSSHRYGVQSVRLGREAEILIGNVTMPYFATGLRR
jgi:hypothetical protein